MVGNSKGGEDIESSSFADTAYRHIFARSPHNVTKGSMWSEVIVSKCPTVVKIGGQVWRIEGTWSPPAIFLREPRQEQMTSIKRQEFSLDDSMGKCTLTLIVYSSCISFLSYNLP